MWVLQGRDADAGKIHYLVCGQVLVVGRRSGHILLTNDASISRKHASLSLQFPSGNLKTREPAKVLLTDLQSKYGTFINDNIDKNQRLSPDIEQELHHGDIIRFGVFTNTWKLEHQDLTVTTSTLKAEGRQQLINALLTLGGHIQNEWSSDCSYLVMPAITLTVKTACALASGRSIVLPEFFTKLSEAIIGRTPHPNPADYLPQVLELKIRSGGASFAPDTRRSSIFAGLTFLFPTQAQMNRMCLTVQLAGGKAEMLSEENHAEVVSGKFLLISLGAESQDMSLYSKTCDLLKEHGLRSIPEAEIGLAILFVSTEGHCNSSFKHSDIFKRSANTSQPSEKLKIFATETQATEFSVSLTGGKVVPESGERRAGTSRQTDTVASRVVPSKRPLTRSDGGGGKPKRPNRVPSPDCTIPLSTLDLCDDDDDDDDGKGENDVNGKDNIKIEVEENTFRPEHTSTQVNGPPPPSPPPPPSSDVVDQSATISFAPYTLPTLKTLEPEDEEEGEEERTQPFQPDTTKEEEEEDLDLLCVKERGTTQVTKGGQKPKPNGGKDLKFDEWWKKEKEEDGLSKKRPRNEASSENQEAAKKTKTETVDDKGANSVKTDGNRRDSSDESTKKRKASTECDENIFALPPRQRHRERTLENMTAKPSGDSDLFALPVRSSRARRLQTQQDLPSTVPPTLSSTQTQNRSVVPSPTLPNAVQEDDSSPDIPATPKTKLDLTSVKENIPLSKFIDRKVIASVENSGSTDEPALSRTLILVEPMIKMEVKPIQPTPYKSHHSNLPNFKIFKKINATCIMKVIGGSDLVENDQAVISQEFNIDIVSDNHRVANRQPSADEELFNLGGRIKKRR